MAPGFKAWYLTCEHSSGCHRFHVKTLKAHNRTSLSDSKFTSNSSLNSARSRNISVKQLIILRKDIPSINILQTQNNHSPSQGKHLIRGYTEYISWRFYNASLSCCCFVRNAYSQWRTFCRLFSQMENCEGKEKVHSVRAFVVEESFGEVADAWVSTGLPLRWYLHRVHI